MTKTPEPLPAARVRRRLDPESLAFESTGELEPLAGLLGQDRAEEAMRFGASIQRKGFNLYVLGPPGMGKHHLAREVIEAQARRGEVPQDWVYVHRFDDADRPKAMALPPGRGHALEEAMSRFVEDLVDVVRAAFETEEFQNRRRVIEQRIESQHEDAFGALADQAEEKGLRLLRTPGGLAFAPLKEGEVLDPKAFAALPEEEQAKLKQALSEMEDALRDLMRQAPRWQREAREALRELERELAGYAVAHQLRELREAFADPEAAAKRAFTGEPEVLTREKFPEAHSAEVWGFDPNAHLGDKGHRNFDRLTKYLIVAAKLALEDAGVKKDGKFVGALAPEQVGICSSTAYGSLDSITELNLVAELEDPRYINPARFPNTVINAAAGYVSIWEDLRAPNATIVDGNCGSIDAVLSCETHLAHRRADAFLVGGGDVITEVLYLALRRLGAIASHVGASDATAPQAGDSDGAVEEKMDEVFGSLPLIPWDEIMKHSESERAFFLACACRLLQPVCADERCRPQTVRMIFGLSCLAASGR